MFSTGKTVHENHVLPLDLCNVPSLCPNKWELIDFLPVHP